MILYFTIWTVWYRPYYRNFELMKFWYGSSSFSVLHHWILLLWCWQILGQTTSPRSSHGFISGHTTHDWTTKVNWTPEKSNLWKLTWQKPTKTEIFDHGLLQWVIGQCIVAMGIMEVGIHAPSSDLNCDGTKWFKDPGLKALAWLKILFIETEHLMALKSA